MRPPLPVPSISRRAKIIIGVVVLLVVILGVLMALVVGANLVLAYRLRPPFRPMSMEQQNLERYRTAIEPRRRLIAIVTSVVLGLFVGLTAQAKWETWLLWRQ